MVVAAAKGNSGRRSSPAVRSPRAAGPGGDAVAGSAAARGRARAAAGGHDPRRAGAHHAGRRYPGAACGGRLPSFAPSRFRRPRRRRRPSGEGEARSGSRLLSGRPAPSSRSRHPACHTTARGCRSSPSCRRWTSSTAGCSRSQDRAAAGRARRRRAARGRAAPAAPRRARAACRFRAGGEAAPAPVSYTLVGTAGANGWYTSNVTIRREVGRATS